MSKPHYSPILTKLSTGFVLATVTAGVVGCSTAVPIPKADKFVEMVEAEPTATSAVDDISVADVVDDEPSEMVEPTSTGNDESVAADISELTEDTFVPPVVETPTVTPPVDTIVPVLTKAAESSSSSGGGGGGGGGGGSSSSAPTGKNNLVATDISIGNEHTCAVTDGQEVYCWGDGGWGRLGTGSGVASTTPDQNTPPVSPAIGSKAVSVAASRHFSCSLHENGDVRCWGRNTEGQLGTGNAGDSYNVDTPSGPVEFTDFNDDEKITQIALGDWHVCARSNENRVWCWGDGQDYATGHGDSTDRSSPVRVTTGLDAGVTQITAGSEHTCAVLSTGQVKCWGSNSHSQLGLGGGGQTTPGSAITGLENVVEIDAGNYHTCARLAPEDDERGGKVMCWGAGALGRLGASSGNTAIPVEVQGIPAEGAVQIAAGGRSSCAVVASDENEANDGVMCWGDGTDHGLGLGSSEENRSLATYVTGLDHGAEMVDVNNTISSGDGAHACAIMQNGSLLCWGEGGKGQIGVSSFEDAQIPKRVDRFVDMAPARCSEKLSLFEEATIAGNSTTEVVIPSIVPGDVVWAHVTADFADDADATLRVAHAGASDLVPLTDDNTETDGLQVTAYPLASQVAAKAAENWVLVIQNNGAATTLRSASIEIGEEGCEMTACRNASGEKTDDDDDGICNEFDECVNGGDFDNEEGTGDGFCDGVLDGDDPLVVTDNCPDHVNPSQADKDGDGVGDVCDFYLCNPGYQVEQVGEDIPALDADGDEICDVDDACDLGEEFDGDTDGFCVGGKTEHPDYVADNCEDVANPEQEDLDGDGIGDPCETCYPVVDDLGVPTDPDNDDICGDEDLCPDDSGEPDVDGDDVCDFIDQCLPPANGGDDSDEDNLCGDDDLCPDDPNPECKLACIDVIDANGGVSDYWRNYSVSNLPSDGREILRLTVSLEGTTSEPGAVYEFAQNSDYPGVEDQTIAMTAGEDGNFSVTKLDVPAFVGTTIDARIDSKFLSNDDGELTTATVHITYSGPECAGVCGNDGGDTDGDGVCEDVDNCVGAGAEDGDTDGVCDAEDNCPGDSNDTQDDADGDGMGDACDSPNEQIEVEVGSYSSTFDMTRFEVREFTVEVPEGASNLKIETDTAVASTYNVDLFVNYDERPASWPMVASEWEHAENGEPSSQEEVSISSPDAGTYHIAVFANEAQGWGYFGFIDDVSLTVSYDLD